jgi:hypothetical protein
VKIPNVLGCSVQYEYSSEDLFLEMGAKTPASASNDAHSHLLQSLGIKYQATLELHLMDHIRLIQISTIKKGEKQQG